MEEDNEAIEFKLMSTLNVGSYIVFGNRPYVITDKTIHKTGKHGHAKANIEMKDVFTDKKMIHIFDSDERVKCPIVKKENYTLSNIDNEGFVSLLSNDGKIDETVKLEHDDIGNRIKGFFKQGKHIEVIVLSALNISKIIEYKIINE